VRLLILLPFIVIVNFMSGLVEADRARWYHLGFSPLIFLLCFWDPKTRWVGVGYLAAAWLNFFSYWLIGTVGIIKQEETEKGENGMRGTA
jgi:hypothetical protein